MHLTCAALAFLFAIAALAQPGTVRVDMQPGTGIWTSR